MRWGQAGLKVLLCYSLELLVQLLSIGVMGAIRVIGME